ncbi:hypothetical protein P3L10_026428 [Capsicum annuum]
MLYITGKSIGSEYLEGWSSSDTKASTPRDIWISEAEGRIRFVEHYTLLFDDVKAHSIRVIYEDWLFRRQLELEHIAQLQSNPLSE